MEKYDPNKAPDPEAWLELDDDDRQILVEDFHRDARIPLPKSARHMHAIMHVIVENQLAMHLDVETRALARLIQDGIDRHEAVHAIGSLLAKQTYELMQAGANPEVIKTNHDAELERLTVAGWREQYKK